MTFIISRFTTVFKNLHIKFSNENHKNSHIYQQTHDLAYLLMKRFWKIAVFFSLTLAAHRKLHMYEHFNWFLSRFIFSIIFFSLSRFISLTAIFRIFNVYCKRSRIVILLSREIRVLFFTIPSLLIMSHFFLDTMRFES